MSTPPWSDIVRDRLLRLGEGRPDDTIVEELGLHLAQSYEEAREGGLDDEQAMSRALADLQGIFMTMPGKLQESLYHVGFQGNRILFATAEVVIGWLLLRQGEARHGAENGGTAQRQQRAAAQGPDSEHGRPPFGVIRLAGTPASGDRNKTVTPDSTRRSRPS